MSLGNPSLEEVALWLEKMREDPAIGGFVDELILLSRKALLAVVYVAIQSYLIREQEAQCAKQPRT